MTQIRIDKWLWAIRIFKTRTLSTKQTKEGAVYINNQKAKASSLVQVGDRVEVRKNGIQYVLEVTKVIDKRVSAAIAEDCYIDHTPEEEIHKFDHRYIGKGRSEIRDKGEGRPTKKDRREIDQFKKQWAEWEFDDEP